MGERTDREREGKREGDTDRRVERETQVDGSSSANWSRRRCFRPAAHTADQTKHSKNEKERKDKLEGRMNRAEQMGGGVLEHNITV